MTTSPATATATAAAAARAARGTPGLGVTAQAHAATIPHAGSHAWTAMVVTARVETSSGFPLVTRAHAKALVAAYDAATLKASFSAPSLTFPLNVRKPSGLAENASASIPGTVTDAARHITESARSAIDGASRASKTSSKRVLVKHAHAAAPQARNCGVARGVGRLGVDVRGSDAVGRR